MTFQWRSIVSKVTFAASLALERPCGLCAMRCAVGSQAFFQKAAFNEDIGKWNVASVTTLSDVCPCSPSRARAAVWGPGLSVGRPLVSPRALGRFGSCAGGASPEAVVLKFVPCGLCAMRRMLCSQAFDGATAFNQALGDWNVARVTTLSGV